ncbi:MAG TPA: periplasmic heavy metal sensor [Thermoanaerobaculia bacterium]|nr:periplasmic heavy metal sensor [Thermoanaerobaculia bacterium]
MRRLTLRIALAVFGLALAGLGLAQNAPAAASPHPLLRHRLRECLAIVDLTDAEKASIQAILDAAAPTIQADTDAVRTARQTLQTALEANPPDACAIGADALALKSARETLRAERQTVLQQVEAALQPDQVARLEGCLAAPFAAATGAGDTPTPSSGE